MLAFGDSKDYGQRQRPVDTDDIPPQTDADNDNEASNF